MVEKGRRVERTNMSAAAGTGYSIPVYTVSTGRTFVLTDLIARTTEAQLTIRLYDGGSQATPTAATTKLVVDAPFVATNIQNGPEFSTGLAAQSTHPNAALLTYAVWAGGIEK